MSLLTALGWMGKKFSTQIYEKVDSKYLEFIKIVKFLKKELEFGEN